MLEKPKAYGDLYNPGIRFDETTVGGSYTFVTGNVTSPVVNKTVPESTPSAAQEVESSPREIEPRGEASAIGFVGVLAVGLIFLRRRR